MKTIRTWLLVGGLIVLTPNLMGGCADELGEFFRGVGDEFDNLADDVDGDDNDDLDDFWDDLFDDDDD